MTPVISVISDYLVRDIRTAVINLNPTGNMIGYSSKIVLLQLDKWRQFFPLL